MKHAKWFALVLLLVLALPAVAGDKDHKCTMETQECLDKMIAKMKNRGWVGIEMDKNEIDQSLSITRVVPGSPAEAAGFQVGDVLLAVNGVKFADNTEDECVTCKATQESWGPGTTVHYVVSRGAKKVKVDPTLAQVPSDVMAAWAGQHMLEHAQPIKIAKK